MYMCIWKSPKSNIRRHAQFPLSANLLKPVSILLIILTGIFNWWCAGKIFISILEFLTDCKRLRVCCRVKTSRQPLYILNRQSTNIFFLAHKSNSAPANVREYEWLSIFFPLNLNNRHHAKFSAVCLEKLIVIGVKTWGKITFFAHKVLLYYW